MVRVSTTEWFGAHLLAPVFADMRLDYPDLIIELSTETRLISLARREADIGFRFREFEEPDVVQTRVADIAFSAYASHTGLQRRSDAGARKEHTLITMDTNFDSLADVAWLSQRLPHATAGLRANSRDVQAKLCAAGGGVAVLPNCVGDATACLVHLDRVVLVALFLLAGSFWLMAGATLLAPGMALWPVMLAVAVWGFSVWAFFPAQMARRPAGWPNGIYRIIFSKKDLIVQRRPIRMGAWK